MQITGVLSFLRLVRRLLAFRVTGSYRIFNGELALMSRRVASLLASVIELTLCV
jgi:hypothetical protein